MTDIKTLKPLLDRPSLFEPGAPLWEDEHISKGMLESHLDPTIDGASRKHEFIDQSAEWINSLLNQNSNVIDLGCGPGLYAERLAMLGHRVTGVDFSKRSIDFALSSAKSKGLDIKYLNQNYLHLQVDEKSDAALMICCDFGVFSPVNRKIILNQIRHILRPGGIFLFDAFTPKWLERYSERKSWHMKNNGFWNAGEALCLEARYLYRDENATVEQYLILSEDGIKVYRNWNQIYTEQELHTLLEGAGFHIKGLYSDVCGNDFSEQSETICVVAETK